MLKISLEILVFSRPY